MDQSPEPQTPAAASTPARGEVRLWHFVVFPTLAMGVTLLLSRGADALVAPRLTGVAAEAYPALRTAAIALVMASVVAWLALRFGRQFERELRAQNRALEEARDALQGIIDGSGEAIIALDAADRVESWNRAAERIFGWEAREMLGQSIERLMPDERRLVEERRRVAAELRAGRTVRDHQTTRRRRDGRPVVVRITWSPRQPVGRGYAGCIAIVLDVTAEVQMRERLVERERLAAVGELAAQVAHEVRNPLAGIRGACEVVLGGGTPPATRAEIGREVLRQIDRLSHTVDDLLKFASPRPLHPVPTDLHEMVDRVIAVLREDPRAAGLKIERRYAAALPSAPVDPEQLEQVLYNLLLNAAQIMQFEGVVTIVTAAADTAVDVIVRDTGPGVPPELEERIFSPFFSTRAQGTGLGLAIVRKIVVAHGGTVRAGRAPGGGAEFRIRLPLETPL